MISVNFHVLNKNECCGFLQVKGKIFWVGEVFHAIWLALIFFFFFFAVFLACRACFETTKMLALVFSYLLLLSSKI